MEGGCGYGCRKCLCESSCEAGGEGLGRRREREGGGRGEGEEEEERREEGERGRGGKQCREPELAASRLYALVFRVAGCRVRNIHPGQGS